MPTIDRSFFLRLFFHYSSLSNLRQYLVPLDYFYSINLEVFVLIDRDLHVNVEEPYENQIYHPKNPVPNRFV